MISFGLHVTRDCNEGNLPRFPDVMVAELPCQSVSPVLLVIRGGSSFTGTTVIRTRVGILSLSSAFAVTVNESSNVSVPS